MTIKEFYDKETATFSYIVDDGLGVCAIIDSVLDYDQNSGRISHKSADELIAYIEAQNLKVEWILETHIHADHLTAAAYLQEKFPHAKIAIGEKIVEVQKYWVEFFDIANEVKTDGSQFDKLFKAGEKFKIGALNCEVIYTPGHTPACYCYKIDDAIFVGDLIFMPDVGSARCDFPGGNAREAFFSLQKILSHKDETKLYTAHDYPPQNRQLSCFTTVLEQKERNILINKNVDEKEFVKNRQARDTGKPVPKLLLPSIQFNIRAGKIKEGFFMKIPVNKI